MAGTNLILRDDSPVSHECDLYVGLIRVMRRGCGSEKK